MSIELAKPFSEYVTVKELDPVGDGRRFVAIFLFQEEGTKRMSARRVEWRYSGAQAAVDEKAGVDGLAPRRAKEIEGLRLALEAELREKDGRVYEIAGQKIPFRGATPK
jgi:hypothetical protein